MEVKGGNQGQAIPTGRTGGSYRCMQAILKGFSSTRGHHLFSGTPFICAGITQDQGLTPVCKPQRICAIRIVFLTRTTRRSHELLQPLWRNGDA